MDTAAGLGAVPLLVYAPGLGRYPANTGVGVAEVLAATLSRRAPGDYRAADLPTVTAPRGLRLGKSVLDPGGVAILHVFELDYRSRMEPASGPGGPAAPPGAVRSAIYALRGIVALAGALGRPAKGKKAKAQLAYALFLTGALTLCALVAGVAALVSVGAGSWIPDRVQDALGTVAVPSGVAAVGVWAVFRRRLLAVAVSVQRNMRYMNESRHRDTVALTLDDAVDGLRDNGWTGPVHVLGYSFGSLVLLDALLAPTSTAPTGPRVAEAVASLTTIGCPVDFVRLFKPAYAENRTARVPDLSWVNVFIAADVLASNLRDSGDDLTAGTPRAIGGVTPDTRQYGDDRLEWIKVLSAKGFRTHGGYWGAAGEASCFDPLVDRWLATT